MKTVKLPDEQWSSILSFLRTCSDVYVGKEAECRRFVEGVLWIQRARGARFDDAVRADDAAIPDEEESAQCGMGGDGKGCATAAGLPGDLFDESS